MSLYNNARPFSAISKRILRRLQKSFYYIFILLYKSPFWGSWILQDEFWKLWVVEVFLLSFDCHKTRFIILFTVVHSIFLLEQVNPLPKRPLRLCRWKLNIFPFTQDGTFQAKYPFMIFFQLLRSVFVKSPPKLWPRPSWPNLSRLKCRICRIWAESPEKL